MKINYRRDTLLAAAAAVILSLPMSAQAANRWWDGSNAGGTGDGASDGGTATWDISTNNWDQGNTLDRVAWGNGNNDTAIFAGTAGTVSLSTNITVGGLQFDTASYIITGNTLTFGAAGSIVANANATISSVIAGSVSITNSGTGTLTLSGANTHSGTTTINEGTLKLQGGAFSTTTRNYSIASGAVLNLDGSSINKLPAGTSTISGAGTLRLTGGIVFGNTVSGGTFNLSLGPGALIDVQAGASMQNGGWNAFNWAANSAQLNVDGNFNMGDNSATVDALTGSGTITKGWDANTRVLTVGIANGSGTFSGTIANSVGVIALTKTGTGTQTLSGANTYTGGTTVNAGTLQVPSTGSLSNSITVGSAGTLTIRAGGSTTRTVANAITLNGGTLQGGVSDNVAAVSILSGAGTASSFVDANGVTIILKGSGTSNTTANLTLASGVTVTGANQLLVGGGGGGGGGRASRKDGGGGGGGFTVLTTGNLSGTLALIAGGGGTAGFTTATAGQGAGGAGNTSSIGATTASGGTGAAPSGGTPTGKGGDSGKIISGITNLYLGAASTQNETGGGGAGSSQNGAANISTIGGAGGAGTQITTGVVGLSGYLVSNTFGGGGGGGANAGGGAGGTGGGGAGGTSFGAAGTDVLGGGGGGGANGTSGPGGNGGAGSLAIQYAYNSIAAAGTLTLNGGITLGSGSTSTLDAYGSGGLIDITTNAITGSGGVNIVSSASPGGVVRFSVANTYTGTTSVSNGVLELMRPDALASNTAVNISTTTGAKIHLNFSGTVTVKSLTINGELMTRNKVYSSANLPIAFVLGDGLLYTLEGVPPKGTLIGVF
jgi:autotransporter-associated beta strand protein